MLIGVDRLGFQSRHAKTFPSCINLMGCHLLIKQRRAPPTPGRAYRKRAVSLTIGRTEWLLGRIDSRLGVKGEKVVTPKVEVKGPTDPP